MDSFIIRGPCRLEGAVTISGAKNAVLPLIMASILTGGKCVLENVPDLRDTRTMMKLIEVLGGSAALDEDTLLIDTQEIQPVEAPYDLVRTMRASIYALGPIVARYGHARVSMPGGCAWGPRPVDLHLKGLRSLGAKIRIDHGYIDAETEKLRGGEIILPIPSVGATMNIMMAAVLAEGMTVIKNAAREPEVQELAIVLKSGGARIEGEGTDSITIEGVEKIEPFHHRVIPDRIEAGTFAAAAVMTGGCIEIDDCRPDHLDAVIERLMSCGAKIEVSENRMVVQGPATVTPLDVETGFYPAFPTDMQAQMMAVLCKAEGASTITEHVYAKRFTHVPELNRLGAKINVSGNVAVVNGVESFEGAPVMATDIRASSALILAGLAAEGETKVLRIYHIDRGYERIEEKLIRLGARIERIKE